MLSVCVSVQAQLDVSQSQGGDSTEEPPSLSSGGFSAPQVSTDWHTAHSGVWHRHTQPLKARGHSSTAEPWFISLIQRVA